MIRQYYIQPSHHALCICCHDCVVHCIFYGQAWYKKVMNACLWHTMEYLTCHLYFLCMHTLLNACVYTKKIVKVIGGIYHGIPFKRIP